MLHTHKEIYSDTCLPRDQRTAMCLRQFIQPTTTDHRSQSLCSGIVMLGITLSSDYHVRIRIECSIIKDRLCLGRAGVDLTKVTDSGQLIHSLAIISSPVVIFLPSAIDNIPPLTKLRILVQMLYSLILLLSSHPSSRE